MDSLHFYPRCIAVENRGREEEDQEHGYTVEGERRGKFVPLLPHVFSLPSLQWFTPAGYTSPV